MTDKPKNQNKLTIEECQANARLMAQYIATLEWNGAGKESGVLAKSYEQLAYWNRLKDELQ
jgi:hypothetical protein